MSKLKDISQLQNNASAASIVSSPQSVASVDQAEIFNTILASASTQDATSQDANQKDPQEQPKDKSVAAVDKAGKADKPDKTSDAPKEAKASDQAQVSEDDKEAKEIDEYQLSMAALAQQLNVALQPIVAQDVVAQVQTNPNLLVAAAQPKIDLKFVANAIPQDLLRKVDVKALSQQLDRLIQKDDSLDVEVPDLGLVKQKSIPELEKLLAEAKDDQFDFGLSAKENAMADMILERHRLQNASVLPGFAPEVAQAIQGLKSIKNSLTFDAPVGDKPKFLGEDKLMDQILAGLPMTQDVLMLDQAAGGSTQQQNFDSSSQSASAAANLMTLTPRQVQQITNKVQETMLAMVREGKSGVTRIQLHPDALGKIDIRLIIKKESISADIVTDNAEASKLLTKEMPHIKAMLAADNFSLDNFAARHDHQHFVPQQQGDAAGAKNEREHRNYQAGEDGLSRAEAELKKRNAMVQKVRRDSILNLTV